MQIHPCTLQAHKFSCPTALYCLMYIETPKLSFPSSKMPRIRGSKTVYSSQEASQLIFMDSESEGDEIDLGEENECKDSYLHTEFEAEEQDTDSSSDEEIYISPKKRKKGNFASTDCKIIVIIFCSNKTEVHRKFLQCLLILCTEFVMNNHTSLFVILDDNEELGNRKRPRHVRSHGNNRNEAENPQVQPVLQRDDRNEAEDPPGTTSTS